MRIAARRSESLQRRIELWLQEQKTSQAIADVRSILLLQPTNLRGRQIFAQLLFIDARFDEAEREAAQCLKAEPNNKEISYLLADIYKIEDSQPKRSISPTACFGESVFGAGSCTPSPPLSRCQSDRTRN